jgi:hypothetical protein
LAVLIALVVNGEALAHDDPIVTVRILCNGFNVLDMDAVLGELSDSASITVDRPVQGSDQIQAWVREQMDRDLRIEITDIGSPEKLPDGYTLSWSARFSRQDWRKAGINARDTTNKVVIRNGRITQWNGTFGASPSGLAAAPAPQVAAPVPVATTGVPEVSGIPVTLILAMLVVASVASFVLVRRFR